MYYNKLINDANKSEINGQTLLDCTLPTKSKNNTESKTDGVTKVRGTVLQNEVADVEKHLRTAITSCTSSTDSKVNVSDKDDIPPHSLPLSKSPPPADLHSYKTTAAVRQCYKEFSKNNKNTNRDNNVTNYKGNNCKIINNNNINKIFNGDNGIGHDDETCKVKCEKLNNKLKVVDICSGGNCTRYQQKTQNIIESENAINISQQQDLTTLTPAATAIKNNDKSSLQHDEFINLQQRPASISSLLFTSSTANSCDGDNLDTNMHHCSGSPVVSIHSISSTIITSDSDEDSDLNSDIEGVNENYVIKKLGTQVTYSPNDPVIPGFNSGQTVLNQKIIPNTNEVPLAPFEAIAAIGDRIGAAQALGPVPSTSGIAQRPQIGSIALNNSSDVTFGDKHFYEGPVTIQQFLIDSRDKWKETNKEDDLSFAKENIGTSANNAKEPDPSTEKSRKLFEYILKRKKLIIPGVLAFAALLVVATILATLNESKSKLVLGNNEESRDIKPINSTIESNNNSAEDDQECGGNATLCLIGRDVWRAHPQKNNLDKQELPLHRVVISHTASEPCTTLKLCSERVRVIQEFHMYTLGWDDIAYNFLISSDGRIFIGRDWDYVGAHTKGYNYHSVGISFIGTYISVAPTKVQLDACLSLLEEGVRLKKLIPDYHLYGARQLGATESPGEMLYKTIKQWEHWSADINLK